MDQSNYSKFAALLSVMRPHQWVKNSFVFLPLLFSRHSSNTVTYVKSFVAFISFCAISSAMYIINDLCDLQEDQQHPTKKCRPIVCGVLNHKEAMILSVVLLFFSLAMTYFLNIWFTVILLLYAIINMVYSLWIKRLVILDVTTIAIGFALRVLGGSIAIAMLPTSWMILCTIMLLCFLGFTKRRAEINLVEETNLNTRQVLKKYRIHFLDQLIFVLAVATIICYSMYAINSQTPKLFGIRAMLLTVPSVIYGVFRYLHIVYNLYEGEDPSQTILCDIPTIINLLIWLLISVIVVNYGDDSRFLNCFIM